MARILLRVPGQAETPHSHDESPFRWLTVGDMSRETLGQSLWNGVAPCASQMDAALCWRLTVNRCAAPTRTVASEDVVLTFRGAPPKGTSGTACHVCQMWALLCRGRCTAFQHDPERTLSISPPHFQHQLVPKPLRTSDRSCRRTPSHTRPGAGVPRAPGLTMLAKDAARRWSAFWGLRCLGTLWDAKSVCGLEEQDAGSSVSCKTSNR